MNPDCSVCVGLLAGYEAVTFEQARTHNSLDIAELLCDRIAIQRLMLDAFDVTARRKNALAVLRQHQSAYHSTGSPKDAVTEACRA